MIPINPWWIHHCAGNLDPKNDPYSDDYENPIYGVSTIQLILTLLTFFIYTGLYGLALFYIITNLTNNYFIFFILFLIDLLIYVTLLIITIDKILK